MKLTTKRIFLVAVLTVLALLVAGCSGEKTPYEINNADNYKISVKFDANGGKFGSNADTTVIVDSYNAKNLPVGADGMTQVALVTPDDAKRADPFSIEKNGYFLAGWYAKCETAEDGTQTFAEPWDFATDRLSVDPNGKYSADEPVLTLYAAWAPLYQVEIYDRANTEEPLLSYDIDPSYGTDIQIPQWNLETGALDMYKFPTVEGKTFDGAYYDAEGQQPISEAVISHPAQLDAQTGAVTNRKLTIYVDLIDGNWFHIYNADQFISNARLSGSYVIHEDLDFTDKIWPSTLMYGNFTGTIQGNGHTISNVVLEQTNNSKTNAGLFGALTETAVIRDLTFQNVHLTIKNGTRVAGTSYGVLAGTVSSDAVLTGVSLLDGLLTVGKDAFFGTEDYVIGSVFGSGEAELVRGQVSVVYETNDEQTQS